MNLADSAALPLLIAGLLLGAIGIRLTSKALSRPGMRRRRAARQAPAAAGSIAPWARTARSRRPSLEGSGRAASSGPPLPLRRGASRGPRSSSRWSAPWAAAPVAQSLGAPAQPIGAAQPRRSAGTGLGVQLPFLAPARPKRSTPHGERIDGPSPTRSAVLVTVAMGAGGITTALGAGWPGVVPVALVLAWITSGRLRARQATRARRAAQAAAAPAVVDLLAACLTAGLNGHLALLRVAERCPAALKPELMLVSADLRVGRSPAVALRAAAERTGLAELRAAAGALNAAERWGAPPAEALAARSEALRSRLRLEAEAAAERAAVRLTFPLVLCFLPAFALLTVVPMLAGAIRALGL